MQCPIHVILSNEFTRLTSYKSFWLYIVQPFLERIKRTTIWHLLLRTSFLSKMKQMVS